MARYGGGGGGGRWGGGRGRGGGGRGGKHHSSAIRQSTSLWLRRQAATLEAILHQFATVVGKHISLSFPGYHRWTNKTSPQTTTCAGTWYLDIRRSGVCILSYGSQEGTQHLSWMHHHIVQHLTGTLLVFSHHGRQKSMHFKIGGGVSFFPFIHTLTSDDDTDCKLGVVVIIFLFRELI